MLDKIAKDIIESGGEFHRNSETGYFILPISLSLDDRADFWYGVSNYVKGLERLRCFSLKGTSYWIAFWNGNN